MCSTVKRYNIKTETPKPNITQQSYYIFASSIVEGGVMTYSCPRIQVLVILIGVVLTFHHWRLSNRRSLKREWLCLCSVSDSSHHCLVASFLAMLKQNVMGRRGIGKSRAPHLMVPGEQKQGRGFWGKYKSMPQWLSDRIPPHSLSNYRLISQLACMI